MAKNDGILIFLGIALIIAALFYFKPFGTNIFAVTGSETMTRTVPASVERGSSFSLTYTVAGASGSWGASIIDNLAGGCTFPSGGTQYKSVMLSEDGLTKTITIQAPASVGTCTFTGDYKFGNFSIITFPSKTVSIVCTPVWSYSSWTTCTPACSWTGKDVCLASFSDSSTQTRTATDSQSCGTTTGRDALSQSCTATCSRTVPKSAVAPNADTDCSGAISRTELGVAITGWSATTPTISRDELGLAMQAWAGGQ
jgi:hypothetical protein